MTPEEINRAIAEYLGWKEHESCPGIWYSPTRAQLTEAWVPKYHSDLNACHEMEKALTDEQWSLYCEHLYCAATARLLPQLDEFLYEDLRVLTHATAPQRCEAFLRTIGKWKGQG